MPYGLRAVVTRHVFKSSAFLLGTRTHRLLLAVLLRALLAFPGALLVLFRVLFALRAPNLDSFRLSLRLPRHLHQQQAVVDARLDVVSLHVGRQQDLPLHVSEDHLAADVVALLPALLLAVGCPDAEDSVVEPDVDLSSGLN